LNHDFLNANHPLKGNIWERVSLFMSLAVCPKRRHKNPIPDQQIALCAHRLCLIGGAESRFAGIALQLFASSRE
jgi:hypothetical protein